MSGSNRAPINATVAATVACPGGVLGTAAEARKNTRSASAQSECVGVLMAASFLIRGPLPVFRTQ
jgi:hypothetical protein